MYKFNYHQPTDIRFGCGTINAIGDIVGKYGKRCLLVTVPEFPAVTMLYDKVKKILKDAGIAVAHFDGVVPNPTTESITAGAEIARKHKADVVLGLGGGSSMDSAKAIAVEATHEGSCWNYLFYTSTPPTSKTLPIIAVTTTSGTGSQVTQVAVVTNTAKRDKSALYNSIIYPRVAIVDPELMLTVPPHITASTGFDALTHSFEAYIHKNASPYTDILAEAALKIIVKNLPVAVKNSANIEARTGMALADTLAGLCIANAGVTLPHGMGMAISGMYPHVMHGEALAVTYPEFMQYTWKSAIPKFAFLARTFNNKIQNASDETAAENAGDELCKFLKDIGMWTSLEQLKVPENELPELARQCMVLPDYEANPKVATLNDIQSMLDKSFKR